MLTLEIQDGELEKKVSDLLRQEFGGNTERMLQALIETYASQLNRLKYSGILTWEQDGVDYQKEMRGEWR